MIRSPLKVTAVFFFLFIMLTAGFSGGQSPGWVREGEPLHLWFKRSPTQNMTTLSFSGTELTSDVTRDIRYRHAIGPKDSPSFEMVTYFPTHQDSNFLQFEYNETLKGNYSFTLSASRPTTYTELEFKLRIKIDVDKDRDGDYDAQISFLIIGNANSTSYEFNGEIPFPDDMPKSFDGKKGGRIKVTMEREDDLNTYVILYCGYLGTESMINLPYSKFTYEPPQENNGSIPTIWIVAIISSFLLVVIFFAFYLSKKQSIPEKQEKPKPRSRRKHR